MNRASRANREYDGLHRTLRLVNEDSSLTIVTWSSRTRHHAITHWHQPLGNNFFCTLLRFHNWTGMHLTHAGLPGLCSALRLLHYALPCVVLSNCWKCVFLFSVSTFNDSSIQGETACKFDRKKNVSPVVEVRICRQTPSRPTYSKPLVTCSSRHEKRFFFKRPDNLHTCAPTTKKKSSTMA